MLYDSFTYVHMLVWVQSKGAQCGVKTFLGQSLGMGFIRAFFRFCFNVNLQETISD